MRTEQEILKSIEEANGEKNAASSQVTHHRKAVIDAESRLITANLTLEKFQEEYRVYKITTPIHPKTNREIDLEEFRKKVPELMKLIK